MNTPTQVDIYPIRLKGKRRAVLHLPTDFRTEDAEHVIKWVTLIGQHGELAEHDMMLPPHQTNKYATALLAAEAQLMRIKAVLPDSIPGIDETLAVMAEITGTFKVKYD